MAQLAALAEHDVKLEALHGDKLKEAYSFWLEAKGDAELPPQSVIAPEKLPRAMLANFSIVTIESDVFRYRLIGTLVTRAWGEDLTGRTVTEVNHGEEMAERMAACVKSRRPYYSQGPLKYAVYDFRSFRVLVMPFAGVHNEVSRLLIYNEFC
ncbi:MAG: PAS domain-containing protein [Alphaproteobacteria bacterium]